MRLINFLTILFLITSCKSKEERILINGNDDLWRVIQNGQNRTDSSLAFFKFNSDNTFNELYFIDNKFTEIDSNPDVVDWHKWEQINDSIFKVAYIEHRIISLSDSFALLGNIKRIQDTLALLRVKIKNGMFTNYR
jgi:hypothetical protein